MEAIDACYEPLDLELTPEFCSLDHAMLSDLWTLRLHSIQGPNTQQIQAGY